MSVTPEQGAPPSSLPDGQHRGATAGRAPRLAPRTPGRPDGTVAAPTAAPSPSGWLSRFDRVERAVHWANAALFAVLVLTGAALFYEPLMALVGRRELVERIHLYAGLCLPVPLVLALFGRWGAGLRADLRRLNRWSPADRRWLRSALAARPARERTRAALQVGKFNAGQKLNAAFTAGGGLVMLATGVLLRWYRPFPLSWRAGATFVHNWLAVLFVVVIAGHVLFALSDPPALRSMVVGRIRRSWAARHAPAWLAELDDTAGPDPEV
jgi:formate dehydrogenase gamma subunit